LKEDPDKDDAAAAGESDDAAMLSPEDWALQHEIQDPEARPPSPPKRELPPENEDDEHKS